LKDKYKPSLQTSKQKCGREDAGMLTPMGNGVLVGNHKKRGGTPKKQDELK
jgi:hypothetical protein